MPFPQITALVPAGEHFDLGAMNEGIWLTTGHVGALENELAIRAANLTTMTADRDTLAQQVAANADTITRANASIQAAADAQTNLATATARITELENQLAEARKAPALGFADPSRADDPPPPSVVKAHANPNSAINRLADKLPKAKKS